MENIIDTVIELEPIPIGKLLGRNFFIPSYQRGYRWIDTQVTQLLNDIWDFSTNLQEHEKGKKPFYCLQPVVVKKRKDNEWEVIDGQQRLSTLYLILKTLENQIESDQKNFGKIFYETRIATDENSIGSEEFLKKVEQYQKTQAEENIDFYHIWKAYHTIRKWFKEKADNTDNKTPRAFFTPVLLYNTKVIWYEINDTDNNNIYNAIDIFSRLNIGKIPLTNAELIKALFLQKGNFVQNETSLKQIQIASEWDIIEKTLQDNAFWYFIYNPENSLKYENRIEYIFDLIKGRTKDSEYYHTFNEFYNEFPNNQNENKPDIVDNIWMDIKRYFYTFDEWFRDNELYHYIGYLIGSKNDTKTIKEIKEKSSDMTKTEFKKYLKTEISKLINCDTDTLDAIEYGDHRIKKILLLFNIQTILEVQNTEMRFSFYEYKSNNWDIEHVRSQTKKEINGQDNRRDWINDILEYFTGYSDMKTAIEEVKNLKEDTKAVCYPLIDLYNSPKIEDDLFKKLFQKISEFFKEGEQSAIHNISNLALLDASTNRSYKNASFPIKRKRIIENDKNGIFVPIATKNLFLKYYSKKFEESMYWNNTDAKDYLRAIKTTLKDYFLPKKEDEQ